MIVAPCKDCADRHIGCHSECELYIEYSKGIATEREERCKRCIEKQNVIATKDAGVKRMKTRRATNRFRK